MSPTIPFGRRAFQPDYSAPPQPVHAGYTEQWMPASPLQIRDATYDRLKTNPLFFKVHKILTYPTVDTELPVLCIAMGPDRATDENEGNQGPPHLTHAFTLFVSIVDSAESAWVLDSSITNLQYQMIQQLLTDPTWVNMSEAVQGYIADLRYPNEAASPLCEARTQFVLKTRSWWEPVPQPRFMELDIRREISATEMDGAPPEDWGPANVLEDDILLNNYNIGAIIAATGFSLSCNATVIGP